MGNIVQLLHALRAALLQSPRLALTAVLAVATMVPFAGLATIWFKDRRASNLRKPPL